MHRTKRNRADTAACSTVKNKERMIFMAVTTESYAGKIQRKLLKKQKVIEAATTGHAKLHRCARQAAQSGFHPDCNRSPAAGRNTRIKELK